MFLCILVFAFAIFAESQSQCPNFIPLQPCSCNTVKDKSGKEFSTITCTELHSEDVLQSVLVACKQFSIYELELIDSSFMYLPHDSFVGTTIEVLSIRNSAIYSLSDSNVAFEGLNNQLHLIEVINCSYTSSWDWSQLSKLNRLLEIHVSESELISITDGLSTLQHIDIEAFIFHWNHIEMLEDNVFAPFVYLKRLALDNNQIKEVKRSMFPNPAKKLKILGIKL
ncbi:slit-like protein [Caerostris extrusa]|uniref:Slit-like protein n=1 Tax=Caerostris extrusa TaxID=172846 RepID=A0AAV4XZB3_CAEEX|nr:slit-like protein [Caerostris extrusa]